MGCTIGGGRLLLFGGRCSISGDSLDASYVVQIPVRTSGVAQWEELHCCDAPAARCYHSAVRGPDDSTMFVFGGAGNGGSGLLGDTWLLHVTLVAVNQLGAMASSGV